MSSLTVVGNHPQVTAHIRAQIQQGDTPNDSFMDSAKLSNVKVTFDQAVKISERRSVSEDVIEVGDDVKEVKTTKREYTILFPQSTDKAISDKGYVARKEVPIETWFMDHKDSVTPFVTKYTHLTKEVEGEAAVVTESSVQQTNWNISARAAAAKSFLESVVGAITEHVRLVAYKTAQVAFTQTGYGVDLSDKIAETNERVAAMENSLYTALSAVKDPVSVISMVNDAISRDETPSFLVKETDLTWGSKFDAGHGDAPATVVVE